MTRPKRDVLLAALLATGALVVAVGLVLGFFGVGAQLQRERDVRFTVRLENLPGEIARQVTVGEDVFVDPGGMRVGRVAKVDVRPAEKVVPDAKGALHRQSDPVMWMADVTVDSKGREGDGLVVLENQVMQAGMSYALITNTYYLRGTVIRVDVR